MIHKFYKEDNIWYIDLPEFLEQGLGTKANLMMIAGADTLLDMLSNNGYSITLEFDKYPFKGYDTVLDLFEIGKNQEQLDAAGHPFVDYGAYYTAVQINGKPIKHKVWLCPVTEYVFGGGYPMSIYIKTLLSTTLI